MKTRHLDALSPICPSCRIGSLSIREEIRTRDGDVLEGLLECQNHECRHLYPIVDGIPILFADLRTFVQNQTLALLARDDLSERMMALLAECSGSGSTLDTTRQHLSTYGWTHYGDLDLEEPSGDVPTVVSLLRAGLGRLEEAGIRPAGPVADLGCSVGRSTFELAAATDDALVLGIDMNIAMLRMASEALRTELVRYPLRRVGMVYEERTAELHPEGADRVDFWCADAQALPFHPETFDLAVSLNLIDSVGSPIDHLKSLRDVVRSGGGALVATPFDWNPSVTQIEAWMGGHSPYDERRGRSENVLRSLLGGDHPAAVDGLELIDEIDSLEWPIRLHDRSAMHYRVDLFVLGRK
ncbi:MAG TPA: methyltransferase domain-containing protein [Actinomycetota bacterium]|nr:methyltransferase domain-containing protein [Actinomycetota bacterium]